MLYTPDYIIVGSGLTGAVIARLLTDAGEKVLVLEKKCYIGGNIADTTDTKSGIRYNLFGPHYFRTHSFKIWEFIRKFSEFYPYSAKVLIKQGNQYFNWPLSSDKYPNINVINQDKLDKSANFEEKILSCIPKALYKQFIENYTYKQWGDAPAKLTVNLAGRIVPRETVDDRLMEHSYQGLPLNGFSKLIEEMLKDIPCLLDIDYLNNRSEFKALKKIIFTGSIDSYFDYSLGKLRYRGQKRVCKYLRNKNIILPVGQVNFSSKYKEQLRVIEWKHMLSPSQFMNSKGTLLTWEKAIEATKEEEREYPYPDEKNNLLYQNYIKLSKKQENILFSGRLGNYQYLDMDIAIEKAFKVVNKLLK